MVCLVDFGLQFLIEGYFFYCWIEDVVDLGVGWCEVVGVDVWLFLGVLGEF